jgi:uncharacterized protein YaaN involved in tellurite resistance
MEYTDEKQDIQVKMERIRSEIQNSHEVKSLIKSVDVSSPNSIMEFGNGPAEEISKFADKILHSIREGNIEGSGIMLKELSKLMGRFDKEEVLGESKKGFIPRMFQDSKKAIEKILSKYQTLGKEIDRIYKEIIIYKKELTKTNDMMEEMFAQNLEYYKSLEKYIIAGNLILKRLQDEELPKLEALVGSGDAEANLNLQTLNNTIEMMNIRVHDLELAKVVSMQTAPQIRIIQRGNFKLVGKIHSAFVITIPIFKNGMIQAVTLKRQSIIAESMAALDKTTNELLLRNAENVKNQSIEIAKLSGNSSIKIETLENTWKTILEGIDETKRIEEENRKLREQSKKKINDMQIEFMKKIK